MMMMCMYMGRSEISTPLTPHIHDTQMYNKYAIKKKCVWV